MCAGFCVGGEGLRGIRVGVERFRREMAASVGTGATGGGGAGTGAGTTRKYKLQKENELRVEVGTDSPLKLQLVMGTAEIFGTELPPMFWMTFPPAHKFAVQYFPFLSFCWGLLCVTSLPMFPTHSSKFLLANAATLFRQLHYLELWTTAYMTRIIIRVMNRPKLVMVTDLKFQGLGFKGRRP